ncbi:MAG: hypothetical protein JWM95_1785 [Gemmatimonadetes bacterium]|nr:hypothetical protein [Gemmatimonadota bacterium]
MRAQRATKAPLPSATHVIPHCARWLLGRLLERTGVQGRLGDQQEIIERLDCFGDGVQHCREGCVARGPVEGITGLCSTPIAWDDRWSGVGCPSEVHHGVTSRIQVMEAFPQRTHRRLRV